MGNEKVKGDLVVRPKANLPTRVATLRRIGFAALLFTLATPPVTTPPVAFSATVTDRPLLFSFNGSDASAGHFVRPSKIAIDDETGAVYVSEGVFTAEPQWLLNEAVSKFEPDGHAANFSALGTSSLSGSPAGGFGSNVRIAVDNSGGNTQGRLYVLDGQSHRLSAFDSTGAFLWNAVDLDINQAARSDVAVDPSGDVWVIGQSLQEFSSTGQEVTRCELSGLEKERFGLDFDFSGKLYVAGFSGVDRYIGCTFNSTLDPTASLDLAINQSSPTGHIFATHLETGEFGELEPNGNVVGVFGSGAIAAPSGIAYNHSLERIYVANAGTDEVEAFGAPSTVGTVPDPTIDPAETPGPATVTFHGTINPQSVANAYYFEWVEASEIGNSFSNQSKRFFRSPKSSLPIDSAPHAVEYTATNVRGNINWRVRLVVENTTEHLRTISADSTFKPPQATEIPVIASMEVNQAQITPRTAVLSGTVNPKEDSVELRIERGKKDPEGQCFASHTDEVLYIPGGGVNTAVSFSRLQKGLEPSTQYCIRVTGRNSAGVGSAKELEFETLPEPPSEVSTAFAAPRTETSARINGRANPEGTAIEYQFEWSTDGSSWNSLPVRTLDTEAHEAIIVSDSLTGLQPGTPYSYRLAMVRNIAGKSKEAGAVKEFTTRDADSENLPPNAFGETDKRGTELVNEPDKGNQNVLFETVSEAISGEAPFVSPNGERARWFVPSGAPGSPSGVGGQFQSVRTGPSATTPTGWESHSLIPPTSQQFGGGGYVYNVVAATPDQSQFIADLRTAGLRSIPGSTLARLDTHRWLTKSATVDEEDLGTFSWKFEAEEMGGVDITDNGAHVLTVDPGTEGPFAKQLVDVGQGSPEVISIMPDGLISECGLRTKSVDDPAASNASFAGAPQWRPGYHMMSATNANLVYFRAEPNADEVGGGLCGVGPLGLYERNRLTNETTLIDPGAAGQNVEFIRAGQAGLEAYFVTDSKLDPTDVNSNADIYRWDTETKQAACLTCIVPDAAVATVIGGALSQVMVSDDFLHIYFESRKALVPDQGVVGEENLYVLTNDAIEFVAAVRAGVPGNQGALERQNAKLSADGRTLLFRSAPLERLTADDVVCGKGCRQVYRYEEQEGSVECISCSASGLTTKPSGVEGPNGEKATFDMSADGSTAAFVTRQALVRNDVNNGADVYEWRDGRQRILTDGVSEPQSGGAAPGIRGIDADGSNIFFSVAEPGLTGFELDRLANLYDARIGGGVPRPSGIAHCSEDSCQGPLQQLPAIESPASVAAGRGNPTGKTHRPPCAKEKVRRHGRCVARHRHRHRKRRFRRRSG
jgi:hypothetical protein